MTQSFKIVVFFMFFLILVLLAQGEDRLYSLTISNERQVEDNMNFAPKRLEKGERILAVQNGGYFPVLIKLKNGELAAVVRGGAPHLGVGGRLDLIKSNDGGKKWSKPQTIANLPPDSRNPAFGQSRKGTLILAFAVTGPYENGQFTRKTEEYTVWLTRSFDNGETWEEPRKLDISPLQYGSPYGKIVELEDGTLLMNIYAWYLPKEGEDLPPEKQGAFAYVWRSKDDGKSWSDPTLIARHFDETTLLPLGGKKVLAIMRDEKSSGLWQSLSEDGGMGWSEPQRITEGPLLPGDAILLESGRILLTYGRRVPPYGVECILSEDKGKTWNKESRTLLEWGAKNTDCGYPSSAQLEDRTIVTLYYGVGHLDYPDLNEYAMCVRYREVDIISN